MTVVTVPVVVGKDRKLYPVGHRRSAEDNQRAADLIHALRHRGASFPRITRRLPEFGLRVSYGSVVHLWQTTICSQCDPAPAVPATSAATTPAVHDPPVPAGPAVPDPPVHDPATSRPRVKAVPYQWR